MSEFPLYALSEEHQAIREAVRAVADAKIAPFAAAVDEEARYPHEAAEALLASDFHAPHVPEQYGGAGADALATVLVIEEVARACVSSSLMTPNSRTSMLFGAGSPVWPSPLLDPTHETTKRPAGAEAPTGRWSREAGVSRP